jgi:hypothetical protein
VQPVNWATCFSFFAIGACARRACLTHARGGGLVGAAARQNKKGLYYTAV